MSSNRHPNRNSNPNRKQPIDPLLQRRGQDLGTRPAGSPLPPPTPSAARPVAESPRGPVATAPSGASAAANARLAALAARRGTSPAHASPAAKPGRRAKPARSAKLASLALSAATTVGLTAMFARTGGSTDSIQLTNGTASGPLVTAVPGAGAAATSTTLAAEATTAAPAVAAQATPAPTPTPAPAPTPAPTTAAAVAAGVLDGTYVGASDTNRWGQVQVQVVYSGGQISDVQILRYPDGDRRSVRISQVALPTLISEAVSLQTADVNTVSGATYTSRSYRISLQSAIDAAKAASGLAG